MSTENPPAQLPERSTVVLLDCGPRLGAWAWTPATGELVWSRNVLRMFGLEEPPAAPTVDLLFDRTHRDDRRRLARELRTATRTGRLAPLAFRIVREDGEIRVLRAISNAEACDERASRRLIGAVEDVTEQWRASRAAAADREAAEPPAPPERIVPLGEAARAVGVSPSTMRRWADSGRIRTVRTRGGHRRFPLDEVQRLSAGAAGRRPRLRRIKPPEGALPAVAAALEDRGALLAGTAARLVYAPPRRGWFASGQGQARLAEWTPALAAACRDGEYAAGAEATRRLARDAECAGTSLLERTIFVEQLGRTLLRALRADDAREPELAGADRLLCHLRDVVLEAGSGP
jgi:excisionase family DNA binding protein